MLFQLKMLNKRILLRSQKVVVGALIGALILRHYYRTIRDLFDADSPRSIRPQYNGFCGVIDDDAPRVCLLGYDLEDAVLEVFVVDRAIIKQSEVGARGF